MQRFTFFSPLQDYRPVAQTQLSSTVPLPVRSLPHISAINTQPHVGRQPGSVCWTVPAVVRLAGHVSDRRLAHRARTGRNTHHSLRAAVWATRAEPPGRPTGFRYRRIRL